MQVASLVEDLLGPDVPVAFEAYDGSRTGPADAPARIIVRSPAVLARLVAGRRELGFGRAYVAGDLDVEGDIYAALALAGDLPRVKLAPAHLAAALRLAAASGWRRRGDRDAPPGDTEARLHGRRHSRERDAAAIAHHYDVSNAFFRLVLGPSMTYSCAVWEDASTGLDRAQTAKHELVCRKLGLVPGMRLLDVGCGWGGTVVHAARRYGVKAVGITLSPRQVEWARAAVGEAGLDGQVEIRAQDYRDVRDGPFDAISSIGMFEHVGLAKLRLYFRRLYELLPPGGRLLNHGIGRPRAQTRREFRRTQHGFRDRFVFPDGELTDVGRVVSILQGEGFETRHVESLREHYALTLRAWVANLERAWDQAVEEVGVARARIWRLYMAAAALNFEAGRLTVHQVLAVRPDRGRSGMPLRPRFEGD